MRKIIFLMFISIAHITCPASADEITIQRGDSEDKVFKELGAPHMKMSKDGIVYCMYDGGRIALKDGVVFDIPDDFASATQRKRTEQAEEERFIAEQKASGLVPYKQWWVTPDQKARLIAMDLAKEEARRRQVQTEQEANRRYRQQLENKWAMEKRDAERKRQFDEEMKFRKYKQASDAVSDGLNINVNSREDIYYH